MTQRWFGPKNRAYTVIVTPNTGLQPAPRIMAIGVGGDQSYGSSAGTGFPAWTTAANGSAANNAIQTIGAYDIAVLNASTEGWDSSGQRDRENLTQALLKNTSYTVKLSQTRRCLPFYYQMMMSGAATGSPYQQYFTLVQNNNWWLYESTGGTGTITPAGGGNNWVNFCAAWPTSVGSAGIGASICGSNYGSLSTGSPTGQQGPARTMGNYAALKYVVRNSSGIDPRFSFNPQMASPSCGGMFMDNTFVALDGVFGTPNSSLDGLTLAPGSQQGGGFPGFDTVQPLMARGQRNMFDQFQTMVATYQPGATVYNFANFGQFANAYQFGRTALLGAGLDNLHGGLLENAMFSGTNAWEWFQKGNFSTGGLDPSGWANTLANYYLGMDFCLAPKMVGLGCRMPTASATSFFGVNGVSTAVSKDSALEYQTMRYGLCTALMDDGYFAPGAIGSYDWAQLRWYDEYGDDSLTQVNVKRGYLGYAKSSRPTAPTFAGGTFGVWLRLFDNGKVLVNPRGNGVQTVNITGTKLNGSQQPTINNGATVTSVTLQDGDGLILLN
jgi:hypothetical protein